jgi:hypothetical protein
MASPLVVCPSCSRHVRVADATCPFCAHAVPATLVPLPRGPRRQYVGKVPTALALASALAAAGCGGDVATIADAAPDTATDTMTADTATTFDVGPDTATIDVAADVADSDVADDGSSFPIYK